VVASCYSERSLIISAKVLIPFIAGQWSLHCPYFSGICRVSQVLIPFIAGQWSLPMFCVRNCPYFSGSLNPLHCGAVVASSSRQWRSSSLPRLNPLHCGAVVASW